MSPFLAVLRPIPRVPSRKLVKRDKYPSRDEPTVYNNQIAIPRRRSVHVQQFEKWNTAYPNSPKIEVKKGMKSIVVWLLDR